jgi:hypothetical protein
MKIMKSFKAIAISGFCLFGVIMNLALMGAVYRATETPQELATRLANEKSRQEAHAKEAANHTHRPRGGAERNGANGNGTNGTHQE